MASSIATPKPKHPDLRVELTRQAAFQAAVMVGYSHADAAEHAAAEAERVRKERGRG